MEGGPIAVRGHSGDRFRDAVAFPHGGLSLSEATVTFGFAATEVAATGVTPEEALVGGETIAQNMRAHLL